MNTSVELVEQSAVECEAFKIPRVHQLLSGKYYVEIYISKVLKIERCHDR